MARDAHMEPLGLLLLLCQHSIFSACMPQRSTTGCSQARRTGLAADPGGCEHSSPPIHERVKHKAWWWPLIYLCWPWIYLCWPLIYLGLLSAEISVLLPPPPKDNFDHKLAQKNLKTMKMVYIRFLVKVWTPSSFLSFSLFLLLLLSLWSKRRRSKKKARKKEGKEER